MAYYLDDTELYLFNEGSNAYAYRALGCHRVFRGRKGAMRFAVWAPCAKAVSVVGDFNDWDDTLHPMEREWRSTVSITVRVAARAEASAPSLKMCIRDST